MCSSFDPIEHHMQQNSIQKVKKESVKKTTTMYCDYICAVKSVKSENAKAVSVMLCVCACVWERTPQHSII